MEKSKIDMADIKYLDTQIETLLSCKPLPEVEVKRMCEKVSIIQSSSVLITFSLMDARS